MEAVDLERLESGVDEPGVADSLARVDAELLQPVEAGGGGSCAGSRAGARPARPGGGRRRGLRPGGRALPRAGDGPVPPIAGGSQARKWQTDIPCNFKR